MYRLRSVLYGSGMDRCAVGLKLNPTCSDTSSSITPQIIIQQWVLGMAAALSQRSNSFVVTICSACGSTMSSAVLFELALQYLLMSFYALNLLEFHYVCLAIACINAECSGSRIQSVSPRTWSHSHSALRSSCSTSRVQVLNSTSH